MKAVEQQTLLLLKDYKYIKLLKTYFPEITKKLTEIFNNWPKGSNRSLSVIESLMDPDTFGGKEDRLPYVEQAFINAEEGID